jgi:hypothetical protein
MHDILIALAFVGMVSCPALVSAWRSHETSEDDGGQFRALTMALANAKNVTPPSAR